MRILGIESSCDETAAAVVEDGRRILSSVVASQDDIHLRYGGVVPELASRQHVVSILAVVEEALSRAKLSMNEVEGIAVTRGPGLIGSLLVGLSTAKAISYAHRIPFVGVHHIEGHLEAALLSGNPSYPLIGLVASGGHTNLYRLPETGKYELLGQSRDDAAGEAFDKVAKICGLGFPGGPAIEKAAQGGDPTSIPFPRANLHPTLDFSFSGVKTAVALWIRKHGLPQGNRLADVAASFQEAAIDPLITKLLDAALRHEVRDVAVCGGVARNARFRQRLDHESSHRGLRLWLAPLELCTDNAAMIAAAGHARLARGEHDSLFLNAQATIPLSL